MMYGEFFCSRGLMVQVGQFPFLMALRGFRCCGALMSGLAIVE